MEKPASIGPGWVAPVRAIVLLLLIAWAASITASFRTTEFGTTLAGVFHGWLAGVMFTVPFLPLLFSLKFLRLRAASSAAAFALRWVAGVALVGALLAEGFAASQEAVVLHQYGRNPGQMVVIERWWPFGNHAIVFTPEGGWWGQD